MTVVARAETEAENLRDLEGMRVNIGNPGSGQRATMEVLLKAMGWTTENFSLASELKPAEQSAALFDNNIDAFVSTVGDPSGSTQEATTPFYSVLDLKSVGSGKRGSGREELGGGCSSTKTKRQ